MSRTDLLTPDAGLARRARGSSARRGRRAGVGPARRSPTTRRTTCWSPQAVVTPRDADQVAALLRVSCGERGPADLPLRRHEPVAGRPTSDGVLVDTRRHFRADRGPRRRRPGARPARCDGPRRSTPAWRRTAASSAPTRPARSACTIGGVVANNSSGMACGTELNTYRTLESAVLVLPERHRRRHRRRRTPTTGCATLEPELHAGLARLRDRVRGNPRSVARRSAGSTRSRTPWATASTRSSTTPARSTCSPTSSSAARARSAFVAEATFRTVPIAPARRDRAAALPRPAPRPPVAARPRRRPASPPSSCSTPPACGSPSATPRPARRCARSPSPTTRRCSSSTRRRRRGRARRATSRPPRRCSRELPLASRGRPDHATPPTRAALWHIRKGLYTAVAGARPSGTTALLEDIAVPVEQLLATCAGAHRDVRRATATDDSVIFGHAKDGNIHFLLNERLRRARAASTRYVAFTDEHGRPGPRPRRHPQGRARHRPDHGAVRPPAVRRRAVRRDARGQGAARPARRAQPRRPARRGPGRARQPPQDRRPPSRTRSTAASSAATASRCARAATSPRHPGAGSCCVGRSSARGSDGDTALRRAARGRVPVRRARHLRRRRDVPDGLPGAHRHRRPHPAASRRAARPRRAGRLADRRAALGRGDPGGRDRADRGPRGPGRAAGRGHHRRAGGARGTTPCRPGPPSCPRAAPAAPAGPLPTRPRSTSRACISHDVRAGGRRPGGPRGVPGRSASERAWTSGSRTRSRRCAAAPRGSPRDSRGATPRCRSGSSPPLRAATEDGRLPVVVDAASCTEGLVRLLA